MSFEVIKQSIPDVLLIRPRIFEDERGFFKESYNLRDFEKFLPGVRFVQINESKSSKGVVRGLHFQRAPHAQAKLLHVVVGAIWDVAVDIRPESSTYKQHVSVELTAENHNQLFIPKGFAHGFAVLSSTAIVQYKTDDYFAPVADTGINPYDPDINVPWPLLKDSHILSEKDKNLPFHTELNP